MNPTPDEATIVSPPKPTIEIDDLSESTELNTTSDTFDTSSNNFDITRYENVSSTQF